MRIINLSGKRLANSPKLDGLRKFGVQAKGLSVIEPQSLKFEPYKMTQTYLGAIAALKVEPGKGDIVITPRIRNSDAVAEVLWPEATIIKFEHLL